MARELLQCNGKFYTAEEGVGQTLKDSLTMRLGPDYKVEQMEEALALLTSRDLVVPVVLVDYYGEA